MILTNDEEIAKKINSAVFPGLQGGPLMHVIAAKAVAFGEALKPEFKAYAAQVVANAKALAKADEGRPRHRLGRHRQPPDAGRPAAEERHRQGAEKALGRAFITCNKNGIPFDPEKPFVTSGVRLGTPAGTTRGFGEAEFRQIALWKMPRAKSAAWPRTACATPRPSQC
jgi:glycine hydroxymethyltransferase